MCTFLHYISKHTAADTARADDTYATGDGCLSCRNRARIKRLASVMAKLLKSLG